jgi:hypothetical protein
MPSTHDIITGAYLLWSGVEVIRFAYRYVATKQSPKVLKVLREYLKG